MAGFDHGAEHPKEVEDPIIAARNARYGMVMFLFYCVIYAGFVGLNAFRPDMMELTPAWGLNVAVLYGFFLIVLAMASLLCIAGSAAGNERHSCDRKLISLPAAGISIPA